MDSRTLLLPGFHGIELLAHGKRLDTWDAWDEDRDARCVVKILREDRLHEQAVREAVVREGKVVTTLAHPHLVRGYECFTDPPAMVLETLRGQTLSAVIEDGAIAVGDVAELGLQLASVIGYLHKNDWLHLDIKPANIVVDHGRAVLIDLSLVQHPGPGTRGAGTPGYLAPEQARGDEFTTATDIWGLGVTLIETLTGEQPHGDEATWDSKPRWPLIHRRAPKPPSLDPSWPEDLRALLLSMVNLDAARRPPLSEVVAVLRPLVQPAPRIDRA